MKTETPITARSINHRVNEEQLQRVLEAKKHRTFEDDEISISKQYAGQSLFGTITVNPCN